jgi:hypothetical protein
VAETERVDQTADELYGLPPGEFTRARDARVKEVRADGDREAAEAIKALRKPTVAAWALNQLTRRRSKDLDRLLKAGEQLRAAQEDLLGGGDRSAFQKAAAKERELVAELSADAAALASEAGQSGSGLQEKVAETLHAAALDEETAEELRSGRMVREREAIGGFGAAAGVASGGSPRAVRRGRGRAAARRAEASADDAAAEGALGEATPAGGASAVTARARRAPRSRKEGASRADAERRQRLAAARTDERHARRELEAAARALEHARERADAAEAHAAEAAQRAKTTAERLKDAKRAETAARKAHTRAARALETAERGSAGKP